MRRVIVLTLVVALSVTVILVSFSGFVEAMAYELLLGVVALGALIALATPIATAARSPRRSGVRVVPPQLLRIERIVRFGTSSAVDADRRLYRLLREQARELLRSRHGVDLDEEPDVAKAMLGDDVWELIRPDRPASTDRLAPGAELSDVDMVVRSIEQLVDR